MTVQDSTGEQKQVALIFASDWEHKDLVRRLDDSSLSLVYAGLSSPDTLNIDYFGRGPLLRMSKNDLNTIHEAIIEKSKVYREQVRNLHSVLVSLRRSEEFSSLDEALKACVSTDAIRYEQDRLAFLFNPQHVDKKFIEALTRIILPPQRDKAKEALVELHRHLREKTSYEHPAQFFMTGYLFPEGFNGVKKNFTNHYGPFTSLLASCYRFSEDENAIAKSARSQLKRGHMITHFKTTNNLWHLDEITRKTIFVDARRRDFGGITLFFSGESSSVMQGIHKGVLGQLRHDNRVVKNFSYDPTQVRNRSEDDQAYANDIRAVMTPRATRPDGRSLEGAFVNSPIEVRITNYLSHGLLEFSERAHHTHKRERNEGEYITMDEKRVWLPWTESERTFLKAVEKEFKFPAHKSR